MSKSGDDEANAYDEIKRILSVSIVSPIKITAWIAKWSGKLGMSIVMEILKAVKDALFGKSE